MNAKEYYKALEADYRRSFDEYASGLEELGVEKRINRLDADTVNRAARADNEHWDTNCARAGIGVLGVWYTPHERSDHIYIDTVVQYEFQWRFGDGDGERRWAKSVITHRSKGSEGLTGMAACMVAYHAAQQQRKKLENRE